LSRFFTLLVILLSRTGRGGGRGIPAASSGCGVVQRTDACNGYR